ncbi:MULTISPECIES: glycoside hydrolase 5 family protein [Burkholderia cepacia complex]|uniref:hypothetical protein n=1 Tax=Burkholderia cepacia complex TaxID=87882 RepID=UPI001CF26A13|nr:hypothetical protein [Burkholderia vietnamiensis]MCA8142919.1 hypothetical protein [Burkholderia multivorans]MCA8291160.1 hypothetical protein [Burkholderia vietnamiensis]WVN04626.1 hypothetical protein V1241_30625 [Burkholderia multivorans]
MKAHRCIVMVVRTLLLVAGMAALSQSAVARPSAGGMWGANVDIAQLLPGDPLQLSTEVGDAFRLARLAGFNTLRVTSFAEWAPGQRGTSYTSSDWSQVGAQAKRNGFTIVPLIGLSRAESGQVDALQDPKARAHARTLAYRDKVETVLDGLVPTGCKIVIDLDNERELDAERLVQLRTLAAFVRDRYPGVLITVGGWKRQRSNPDASQAAYVANYPDDGAPLADIVDIVSVHLYDEALSGHRTYGLYARSADRIPAAVVSYLQRVQSWAKGKPILVSEFGAPNGVLPTRYRRDLGRIDPVVQDDTVRSVLHGILKARARRVNVAGALMWIMAPRGGDAALHDESNEWSLAVPGRNAETMEVFPAMWEFCRMGIVPSASCSQDFPSEVRLRTADPRKIPN